MSGRQPGMLDASRTDPPDLERIRRLAKQWAGRRRRLTRSAMEDFTDIYMIILGTAIVVMMTIQGLGVMGSTGSAAPSGSARLVPGDAVGQPVWLAVGAVIALIAIGLGPLRRLGPLFLRPEQAQWWLPLPGDRSALLRRLARRELAVVWALSSAAGAVIALVERSGVLGAARWSVLVGGVAGLSLAALLAAQAHGGPVVVVRARTTALSAAGACAGASLLSPLSDAHAALVPVIIGAVLVLATAIWWRRGPGRHLAELDDDSLLQASARAFGAHAAALAMDTRALGRMISSPPRRPTRPAGLRLARVCVRLPGALRTVLGVGAVDWLLLARQPWRLARVAASALLVVGVVATTSSGLVTAVVFATGGWFAALAVAEPARRAHADPGPDESWAARPVWVRAGHLLVPTGVMLLWALSIWGALVLRAAPGQGVVSTLPLAIACGVGWGGVALRSGFRRDPDFSTLILTPLGAIPAGAVGMVVSGPDAAVLVCLPAAPVVAGLPVTGTLVAGQVLASALALIWALRVNRAR